MTKKLENYYELVRMTRESVESPDLGIARGRLKDITKKIKRMGALFADSNANMEEVMLKLRDLKREQKKLDEQIANSGEFDRTSVKKQIVDVRKEILETKHAREWDKLVSFFNDNPVALTSLIHQTEYDRKDPIKVLKTLPFRGRVSGPYGTRYQYVVKLADDTTDRHSSVRKVILSLDQYNRDFRSLALTFDALKRFVTRGISVNGVKVTDVVREPKPE